ncbi:MAG: Rne/Rng family ribonuclease [Sphingomonadales bacterium]|nr:Rne/Rng family ribonuclease [Sphingomonadales bacterium]
MPSRMLIDARHPEETRVVVLKGNRIEEFDYESSAKRQLKGNIYLAKVTRVEPSLQAAFVDYGGNRHGFLAFSEIHPDYYQIPLADREALLAEEAEALAKEQEAEEAKESSAADSEADDVPAGEDDEDEENGAEEGSDADLLEAEQEIEEAVRPRRRVNLKRRYKIQEVIKRRQILLIQVVKEERGNKGAAVTTYLSLAGRYCVLMPNTTHGGGVSRKITNTKDRGKLKKMLADLDVPSGMGCIIRTAGMKRTKAEVRRDFEYLVRLWEDIRSLTLNSVAPTLIHEEGNLIKRAIRDLYTRDIDEILVEGDESYRAAKDIMRVLTPSHAKKVQHYKDRVPMFQHYKVESQLDALYSPVVQLKSGGYVVLNPTEALVAIDVNSGKATKEHNIEETALKTNQEAAEEIARQLRLRDMAGLVVIDFIDMEERSNNRTVERRMKDALKSDRARIQVGRISQFGLMEMSRQRLRPGLLEASSTTCPVCKGSGMVRSVESSALHVLRAIEDQGLKGKSGHIKVGVPGEVGLYIFNNKRRMLSELESAYDFGVTLDLRADLVAPDFELDRSELKSDRKTAEKAAGDDKAATAETREADADDEEKGQRKRRRRRRGRRGGRAVRAAEERRAAAQATENEDAADSPADKADDKSVDAAEAEAKPKRPRRRRTRKPAKEAAAEATEAVVDDEATDATPKRSRRRKKPEESAEASAGSAAEAAEEKPKRRRTRSKKSDAEAPESADAEKPKRRRSAKKDAAPANATPESAASGNGQADAPAIAVDVDQPPAEAPVATSAEPADDDKPASPPRKGWWQRISS